MINDIVFSNSFMFTTYEFSKHKRTDNRNGISTHYFAYMLRGHAKLTAEGRTVEINEGDAFYIPNGKCYQSFWYGEPNIKFISLAFGFMPVFDGKSFDIQRIDCSERESRLFEKIISDGSVSAATVGDFYTLAGMLIPKMISEDAEGGSELVRRAKGIISLNPRISVSELSKLTAVSESALYLSFKTHSDKSIHDYRQSVIMEKAKELLISTDIPIEQLSENLGFSSSSYFRKQIHSYFGISPKEIRKNLKI